MFLGREPRIAAIVLDHDSFRDTQRCVAAIRRSTERSVHLLVVDNGSSDEGAALRHALSPSTTILQTGTNLGYAGGNNVGIRHALERDIDLVWILNPDAEPEPEALATMQAAMADRPDIGVVGSLNLVGGSRPAVVQFGGGRIHWDRGAATESIGLGRPESSLGLDRRPMVVDYVAGTSMLIRRRVFEEIGTLPERYFLYHEETDFQVRARIAGWTSVLQPRARVWHHQRSADWLPAPTYLYYFIRSRFLFAHRFTDLPDGEIEGGLTDFVSGWRRRVTERRPEWLPTFERLVRMAVRDGRADVTGPRRDIHLVERPAA